VIRLDRQLRHFTSEFGKRLSEQGGQATGDGAEEHLAAILRAPEERMPDVTEAARVNRRGISLFHKLALSI
jgi:hypothetical protein